VRDRQWCDCAMRLSQLVCVLILSFAIDRSEHAVSPPVEGLKGNVGSIEAALLQATLRHAEWLGARPVSRRLSCIRWLTFVILCLHQLPT
jgi:hypothetical protein